MRPTALLLTFALAASGLASSTLQQKPNPLDPNANETKAHRDARMHWWREARFGMFIHWGLYAQLAGTWDGKKTGGAGEWIMHDMKIPVEAYASNAKNFDPEQFNADQWVGIAKAAGMKYIVMTAKHHEGFAMFHSSTDPFNLWDMTPFKRDPIAEMGAACKRAGLKFGVYYSQAQDWHHAGGAAYGGHWDPMQDGDLHEYVRKVAAPQVKELLTKYKPAILWWDTSVPMSDEDIKALTASFGADPGLIANNRLGNGIPGDTETPEQYIPPTGYPGKDWETCMTMNDTWGYKSFDNHFKSTEMLIHNLIDIASKGGNYLLNVGPEPTGLIPAPEVERLKEMGEWLGHNGESIYATTASPYKRLPFDGRCTVKGHNLYVNVFAWPEAGLSLAGLQTPIRRASVIATGQRLKLTTEPDGSIQIERPSTVDAVSTAIKLELSGPPVVVEPEYLIPPKKGGGFDLSASEATMDGGEIATEVRGRITNIGYWTNKSDAAQWKVRSTGGTFNVALNYSCEPATEGSSFEILVDGADSGVGGVVAKTASWADYQTMRLSGTLTMTPGNHVIKIVAKTKPGFAVMNLRKIVLTPVTNQ
jgi:alpha-L-fucosidase